MKKNIIFSVLIAFFSLTSQAGVFTTAHFINQGSHAIGVEPEVTLSNGAGAAVNLRYTYGATDLNNLTAIIGNGGGPRRFRFGGNFTFDFFPDVDKQPGIGIAAQGMYYRTPEDGMLETTLVPYIHKSFKSDSNDIEPFLAFPFGIHFKNGKYEATSNLAIGSIFKASEQLRYVTEIGIAVNHSETYVSGGLIYYP